MSLLARAAITFLAIGFLYSSTLSARSKKQWMEALPASGVPIEIQGKKSSSKYYLLDQTTPVSVKVVGPGTLKVYTRTEIPADRKEAIYGVSVVRDGKKRYLISRTASISKVKIPGKSTRIGEQKSVTFKVPKGTHEFELTLPQDAKSGGYVRFLFAGNTPKPTPIADAKYIPFLPRKFEEEVRVVVKEEQYIYYRIGGSAKVEVEVIGPARLKIVSRLEFTPEMLSEQSYRLQINNQTELLQTKPLKGKISAVAVYREPSKLVLGRGDTSYLDVPEGRHRYTISTPDRNNTILLRFYLPEKALGNEWIPAEVNGKADLNSLKKYVMRG